MFHFALRVMNLVEHLPPSRCTGAVANQLVRCGTAVSANYRAARRARSTREFIARLGVVEEEADEAAHWLELVIGHKMLPHDKVDPLLDEARQIVAIVVASIKTSRLKLKKRTE
jgi:four helix bundle protein